MLDDNATTDFKSPITIDLPAGTLLSTRARVLIGVACIFVFLVGGWNRIAKESGENLHAHQAKALLQGRLDIDQPLHDTAHFESKYFVPFPPSPAVLLAPFVAVFGVEGTKVTLISIALTLLNIFLLLQIFERLGVSRFNVAWLVIAFLFGTGYWSAVRASAGVWFFAHIVAVTCSLLAIHELLGRSRGAVVGLWIGLAFLARQLTIAQLFFATAVLWTHPENKDRRAKGRAIAALFLVVMTCVTGYLAFNHLRFGNPLEAGYSHIPLSDFLQARVEKHGLFSIAYLPFNLVEMFLQGFHVEFRKPDFLATAGVDPFGTSITFASPFVFAAFWAKWNRWRQNALWLSVLLMLIPHLLYYNNGWVQWNAQRFTLDFLPLLFVLLARGIEVTRWRIWKVGIAYSVFLNVITVVL